MAGVVIVITRQQKVARWRDVILTGAKLGGLDPYLVAGVVAQESGGDQYAQRVERGFWTRYLTGIMRWVKSTASTDDDRWAQYPDIYASSYGLCQVMLQTAAESGFGYRYPGELFDPETNLRTACKILARLRAKGDGTERDMLLRYNGGGDPSYPDRVFAHRDNCRTAGILE